jgi:hypothetical protein
VVELSSKELRQHEAEERHTPLTFVVSVAVEMGPRTLWIEQVPTGVQTKPERLQIDSRYRHCIGAQDNHAKTPLLLDLMDMVGRSNEDRWVDGGGKRETANYSFSHVEEILWQ